MSETPKSEAERVNADFADIVEKIRGKRGLEQFAVEQFGTYWLGPAAWAPTGRLVAYTEEQAWTKTIPVVTHSAYVALEQKCQRHFEVALSAETRRDALARENADLRAHNKQVQSGMESAQRLSQRFLGERDAALAKLNEAKGALEFYADQKNWRQAYDSDEYPIGAIGAGDEYCEPESDCLYGGKLARECLERIK